MRSYAYLPPITLLALTGCPIGDMFPDGTESESTSADPTSGTTSDDPTGGAPFTGVIAPVVRTYLPLSGPAIDVAYDPTPDHAALAIVLDGGADAQVFPGVYDGSSRLEFADVPEVSYLLRRSFLPNPYLPGLPGTVSWTETAARELGLFGGIYSGRPDVVTTKELGTAVAITATGLPPLDPEHAFELYSYGADIELFAYPSFDPLDGTNSPEPGATTLSGWTVPWQPATTRSGSPLVDPGKGDDLWLAHHVTRPLVAAPTGPELKDPWSYADLVTLSDIAQLELQPMAAGATAALTGTFAPVQPRTITADLRLTKFRAELESLFPFIFSLQCNLTIVLEPGIEHPVYGMTPYLGWTRVVSQYVPVDPQCPPDACDPELCDFCDEEYVVPGDRVVELSYANPYPAGTEMYIARCRQREYLSHPETGDEEIVSAIIEVSGKLADLTAGPIVPNLGLAGDIRINGDPSSCPPAC
jgi:hypothetical protein